MNDPKPRFRLNAIDPDSPNAATTGMMYQILAPSGFGNDPVIGYAASYEWGLQIVRCLIQDQEKCNGP